MTEQYILSTILLTYVHTYIHDSIKYFLCGIFVQKTTHVRISTGTVHGKIIPIMVRYG